jgi:hypothetical protein
MSSLAFLRKAAIKLSEIGRLEASPGLDQRRPRDTFFHRVLVIHLRIHFLALVGGEKFDELDRVPLCGAFFASPRKPGRCFPDLKRHIFDLRADGPVVNYKLLIFPKFRRLLSFIVKVKVEYIKYSVSNSPAFSKAQTII